MAESRAHDLVNVFSNKLNIRLSSHADFAQHFHTTLAILLILFQAKKNIQSYWPSISDMT